MSRRLFPHETTPHDAVSRTILMPIDLPMSTMHDQMLLLVVMMQRHTVELEKRIRNLPSWRRHSTIKRYALQFRRRRRTDIDAGTIFDVSEIDRVDGPALVWDHGWFHVSEESPGDGFEEGVVLDVGGAGAGAETAHFVFDEEFADD